MKHFGLSADAAIVSAVAFAVFGLVRPSNRKGEKIASLLFDGAAFGPLALLFASPFSELAGVKVDLFEEVVKGESVLLWLAVTYAGFNLIRKL